MRRLKQAHLRFKGTRGKAVDYILAHPEVAAFLSIDELAKKIGISTSSLSRTAVDIGYSGFPEMQGEVQEYLRQKMLPAVRMEAAVSNGRDFSFNDSIKKDICSLEKALADISAASFEAAVSLIAEAKEVFVVGVGTQYPSAIYFCEIMKQIRKNITLVSMDYFINCFARLTRDDLVITICLPRYSRFTVEAAQEANILGCKILAITDSELSPTGKLADLVLPVAYDSMSFFNSNVAVMAVLNALGASIALKNKKNTRGLIDTFNNLALKWKFFYNIDAVNSKN